MKPHCRNCFAPMPTPKDGEAELVACPPGRGCYPPDRMQPFRDAHKFAGDIGDVARALRIRAGAVALRQLAELP